jgi:hypothetical protein
VGFGSDFDRRFDRDERRLNRWFSVIGCMAVLSSAVVTAAIIVAIILAWRNFS